jgi:hypothetical protein
MPSFGNMLDAAEWPGERSGDGEGSVEPNGSRIGRPLDVGRKCWFWSSVGNMGAAGDEASITVGSRPGSTAASVDCVRREFFRGMVGARLGGPRACVTRDARDPILLGSSIPPPVSMGPNVGAIAEIL